MALEHSQGSQERLRGEQVPPSLPSPPQLSAHPASLPKTEPSCFQKWLEPGVFPNLFYCQAFREVRQEDAPAPKLLSRSRCCCCQSCGTSACLFCSSNSQPAGTRRGTMQSNRRRLGHRPASRSASPGDRQLAPSASQTLGFGIQCVRMGKIKLPFIQSQDSQCPEMLQPCCSRLCCFKAYQTLEQALNLLDKQ